MKLLPEITGQISTLIVSLVTVCSTVVLGIMAMFPKDQFASLWLNFFFFIPVFILCAFALTKRRLSRSNTYPNPLLWSIALIVLTLETVFVYQFII